MRRTKAALFAAAITLLVACQKERSFDTAQAGTSGGGGSNSIIGTWKFIQMEAKTNSTVTASDPSMGAVKTVTTSEYTTIKNAGSLKIDDTKMSSIDVSYSIDAIAKGYFYENNTLIDEVELPMQFVLPPTNYTASYKKIGNDSIRIDA